MTTIDNDPILAGGFTLLTTEQLAKRIPYDIRSIRELLIKRKVFQHGRHLVRVDGSRRLLFVWETICADMGLPHANFAEGDLISAEEVSKRSRYDVRTIRETLVGSGRWVEKTHYVKISDSEKVRRLIFVWPHIERELTSLLTNVQVSFAPDPFPKTATPQTQSLSSLTLEGEAQTSPIKDHEAALRSVATPFFALCAQRWLNEDTMEYSPAAKFQITGLMNKYLFPRFEGFQIGEISKQDVSDTLLSIGTHDSHRVASFALSVLKQIFDKGFRLYQVPSPISDMLIAPKSERTVLIPRLHEVIRIIEAAPEKFRPYFAVRAFSGLKNEEAHSLRWKNVDFNLSQIVVDELYTSGEWVPLTEQQGRRVIPVSQLVIRALRSQRAHSAPDQGMGLVFHNDKLKPLDSTVLTSKVWEPLLNHLGVRYFRLSQIRHIAPFLWLSSGESPDSVANWAGIESASTLKANYSHLVDLDIIETPLDRMVNACFGATRLAFDAWNSDGEEAKERRLREKEFPVA